MATGARLAIDIAEKRFGPDVPPLFSRFRLEVEPGTVLAVVGPSGIGKSSLLRMVGGIDSAFDGRIDIDGTAAASAPPSGFVFQDARLLPWLTAAKNLTGLLPRLSPADATAALARVGLAGSEHLYPHQLSGGMQRRVALARALAANPRLLLLDEPFVSLDRELVEQMQLLVLELLQQTGATALLVTHLPEDAARLAHRAILLGGRPATIAADIAFDVPPAARSETDMRRFTTAITAAG